MPSLRVLTKIAAFTALVCVAQILLCHLFPSLVLPNLFAAAADAVPGGSIVFVGDSAIQARGPEFVSLPEMLAELRPDDTIEGHALLGQNAKAQFYMVQRMLENQPRPKAVVVGLDLPLMFPRWNPFREAQEERLRHMAMCRPLVQCFTKPAAVFKFFDYITTVDVQEPAKEPLEVSVKVAREAPPGYGHGDFAQLPEDLEPADASYVRALAALEGEYGIPIILYLSPINLERAEWVFGPGQKEAAGRHVQLVQRMAREGGGEVHDWLNDARENEFEPNEVVSVHMLSMVQRRIAERLDGLLEEELSQGG